MKRLLITALVALALPAGAFAKGPSAASIAGPGLTTIRISGAEGSATPFWRLTEAAGFFEAVYGPSRLPQTRPRADLGPRYEITWTVPETTTLHQDVYPYAKPYPMTYMPPRGKVYGARVKGGWYVGGARLKKALVGVGVPAQPPVAFLASHKPARPTSGSDLSTGAVAAIAAGGVALALLLFLGIRAWRRPRGTINA